MKRRYSQEKEGIRGEGQLRYKLIVRQQPVQARLCSYKEKVDRRPIDPPPIVQLKVEGTENEDSELQNPFLFLYVSVARESYEELSFINGNRTTAGTVVQSLYKLKDLDNNDGGFFIFPDISVRVEGRFRLKFSLYEITGHEVVHRGNTFSDVFTVYSPKLFPGMEESTRLTRLFSDQGFRMRIRKENRTLSRRKKAEEESSDQGSPMIRPLSPPSYSRSEYSPSRFYTPEQSPQPMATPHASVRARTRSCSDSVVTCVQPTSFYSSGTKPSPYQMPSAPYCPLPPIRQHHLPHITTSLHQIQHRGAQLVSPPDREGCEFSKLFTDYASRFATHLKYASSTQNLSAFTAPKPMPSVMYPSV
ncbi:uncharacterized protein VTP21DRAFT_10467 [Calcarisporiella thermophila]|uniref:uncharacterized protein n=1 Tax=Calcarisporiella thermophila TaxID=911321 RepID=UPI0037444DD5